MLHTEEDDVFPSSEAATYDDPPENECSYSVKADIMPRSLAITMIIGALVGLCFWAILAFVIAHHYL